MAKTAELERKWYIIDAAGQAAGQSCKQQPLLFCAGKVKPTFTPHVDCGDLVIILNADKAVLTGETNWCRSITTDITAVGSAVSKRFSTKTLMAEKRPEQAMECWLSTGMLPHNTLGAERLLTRLQCLQRQQEHNHAAQNPEVWTHGDSLRKEEYVKWLLQQYLRYRQKKKLCRTGKIGTRQRRLLL